MSRCDHANAEFRVMLWRELTCHIRVSEIHDDVLVRRDQDVHIKVTVTCPDCDLRAVYNAWADPKLPGTSRWPAWVLQRLIALRAHCATVHNACLACHVPPEAHPSWR